MQAYDESCNSTPMVTFQRNGSLSCPVQFLRHESWNSFSYNKIPPRPLKLTVLKLDGSSFDIEVPRNGTVADLKKAVEAAFSHLPCKVSWQHVWGHFCLSHDYEKLLSDSDHIGLYGIRDGDQLEFMRHVSVSYLGKRQEREGHDMNEPYVFNGFQDKQAKCIEDENTYLGKLEYHRVDIYDDDDVDDEDLFNDQKHKVIHLLRKWLIYRKRLQRKGSVSRFFIGNSRNVRSLNQYIGSVASDFESRSCNVAIM